LRQAIIKAIDVTTNILRTIGGILLFCATLLICTATANRYIFGHSWEWAEEVCRMMVLAASFWLAGHMEITKGQVYLSVLVDKIRNPKILMIFECVNFAAAAVVSALIAYWGTIQFIRVRGQLTFSQSFPRRLPSAILPIGMAILTIYCVSKLILIATDKGEDNGETGRPERN
jgi:TRAP-type C4-dicarboxylate transport system permease small subunit